MDAIALDRDAVGLGQHPPLGRDQSKDGGGGQNHHAHAPQLGLNRPWVEEVINRLAPQKRARCKDQPRLHQTGEGFGLAVAEPVFGVGRFDGVAHGEKGGAGGDEIEGAVARRGQKADRAGIIPGHALQKNEQGCDADGNTGDPTGQGCAFVGGQTARTRAMGMIVTH